jgi:O-antigen ligase
MRAQSLPFRSDRLPQRAAPRFAGAASISPVLTLIAVVIFLPEELSFYLGQFRLTLIRLVLFSLAPALLIYFGQLLASRKRHLVLSDVLIVLTGIWMIVSPAIVIDLEYSLHHSAPNAAEFCGSYLAGRVLLSERGQSLRFVDLLCYVIAIVALIGVLDTITSAPTIHYFLAQLTGYTIFYQTEYRLGIFRAMGTIEHPILFGIVCAVGLLLAVGSPIRAKGLTMAACGLGVLLSLSSAPVQAAIMGLGLLTYDRIFARFRWRWLLLIVIVALGIGASYAFTASPFAFIYGHLSIDPASYWARLYQWNTVGAIVLNSPWFGIGFELRELTKQASFFVQASVDSLWLNLALVYGIPGAVLVGLSMLSATCYPAAAPNVNLTIEESKLATTLSVVIFLVSLLGFTVHFWGVTWMLVGLLVGVRAHLADLGSRRSLTRTKTNLNSAPRSSSISRSQTRTV